MPRDSGSYQTDIIHVYKATLHCLDIDNHAKSNHHNYTVRLKQSQVSSVFFLGGIDPVARSFYILSQKLRNQLPQLLASNIIK